ncbi:MAG TPA: hypothetical protein VFP32_01155 [Candidatus Saccharimonadales bacterium]|nr:hypothetical protein [Candidatus Saccharimonadales bacterium]
MDNPPSSQTNNQTEQPTPAGQSPEAEVLKPRTDDTSAAGGTGPPPQAAATPPANNGKPPRHRAYRPSHKATFISLAVVVAILLVNVVLIGFVLKNKSDQQTADRNKVTISSAVLDKLGVNTASIGNDQTKLTIGPDAEFKGKITVAGDANFGGAINLNGKVSGTGANFTQLQAGDTSLAQLNVNGDGTLSNLNLRQNLTVAGKTQLQGAVTISQLLTVNNNVSVTGSLSIGGTFSARSLTSTGTFTVGGHVVTAGSAPAVSAGPAVGSNGTVSISGNDAAGTVAVNIGVGGGGGVLASISFRNSYGDIPHVVISPIGAAVNYYVNRSPTGFSIGVSGAMSPGGYAFDYIVEQ